MARARGVALLGSLSAHATSEALSCGELAALASAFLVHVSRRRQSVRHNGISRCDRFKRRITLVLVWHGLQYRLPVLRGRRGWRRTRRGHLIRGGRSWRRTWRGHLLLACRARLERSAGRLCLGRKADTHGDAILWVSRTPSRPEWRRRWIMSVVDGARPGVAYVVEGEIPISVIAPIQLPDER